MPTNAATAISDMQLNLQLYEHAFKAGLYRGMDIIATEFERTLKEIHNESAWWNEPASRTPGDLEHTYVGFVQAAVGDSAYLYSTALSERGAMRNWDSKPMYPGMTIATREGEQRDLSPEAYATSHTTPDVRPSAPIPGVVRAFLTSPMNYAFFQEKGPYAYPVLDQVIYAVAPYAMEYIATMVEGQIEILAGDLRV